MLCQFDNGIHWQFQTCICRDTVQDDRDGACIRYLGVMVNQSLAGHPPSVETRVHHEYDISSSLSHTTCHLDGSPGGFATRPRHQQHALGQNVSYSPYHIYTLLGCEAGVNMVVEGEPSPSEQAREQEVLCWLNRSLQTELTKVEQACSGGVFCQLMNSLVPGSINMDRVNLQAQQDLEVLHNYSLLQVAFRNQGISKTIPVESLMQQRAEYALDLLLWFKSFATGDEQKSNSLKPSKEQAVDSDQEGMGDNSLTPSHKEALVSDGVRNKCSILSPEDEKTASSDQEEMECDSVPASEEEAVVNDLEKQNCDGLTASKDDVVAMDTEEQNCENLTASDGGHSVKDGEEKESGGLTAIDGGHSVKDGEEKKSDSLTAIDGGHSVKDGEEKKSDSLTASDGGHSVKDGEEKKSDSLTASVGGHSVKDGEEKESDTLTPIEKAVVVTDEAGPKCDGVTHDEEGEASSEGEKTKSRNLIPSGEEPAASLSEQKCNREKDDNVTQSPPQRPKVVTHLDFSKEGSQSETSEDNGITPRPAAEAEVPSSDSMDSFPCSVAILRFLRKRQPAEQGDARSVLGRGYPDDVASICSQTSYCLYLYAGVEMDDQGEEGNVIVIGYFDQRAGAYRLRLLDVVQPMEDAVDSSTLTSLVDTLKQFNIPVENLVSFYSNTRDADQAATLTRGLKALKPSMVSFCGLVNLAALACQEGMLATGVLEQIMELFRKMTSHAPSSLSNDSLKQLFADLAELDTNKPVKAQCLSFIKTVSKVYSRWATLTKFFASHTAEDESSASIHALLTDKKLKLLFMFLDFSLKPLSTFQESLDNGADLAQALKDAPVLLQLYASSFLQLSAVTHYLKKQDETLLKHTKEHLPNNKVKVGEHVRDFLAVHSAEFAESLKDFYKMVIAFYVAVTASVAKSMPLTSTASVNITAILKPEGRLAVASKAVTDIASLMGISQSPDEVAQLTDDFLEYQLSENTEGKMDMDQHWRGALKIMEKSSAFRKLILSLLSFPRALKEDEVFREMFLTPTGGEKNSTGKDQVADGNLANVARRSPKKVSESSSSDAMETGETEKREEERDKASHYQSIVIDDDDDDDRDDGDDIIWTDTSYNEGGSSTPSDNKAGYPYKDGAGFEVGEMVWGNVSGCSRWPGVVLPWRTKNIKPCIRKIRWFGDGLISRIHVGGLHPYRAFAQCFCPKSLATLVPYKPALLQSLQMASERCQKEFYLSTDNRDELLQEMLDWARSGFQPSGPRGLRPGQNTKKPTENGNNPALRNHHGNITTHRKTNFNSPASSVPENRNNPIMRNHHDSPKTLVKNNVNSSFSSIKANGDDPALRTQTKVFYKASNDSPSASSLKQVALGLGNLSMDKDKDKGASTPEQKPIVDQEMKSPQPSRGRPPKNRVSFKKDKAQKRPLEEDQPVTELKPEDTGLRAEMVHDVLVKGKNIEAFCLSCGMAEINIFHPLFEGSLCTKCKDNFTETLYRYDEDGYQSYCTVCCWGLEVILCGNHNCCRSYCVDCLNILVGAGTFDKLKEMDPWICYLCEPASAGGALRPREDWSIRVQEFFANDSGLAFEPHRVYPSVPASQRKPIRVLSLFDGIATGYLVLKELGFKMDTYVASEIDDESIAVSMVNHDNKITHVDDVRSITKEHLEKWGPFDLLIGGSPCNDLSIVNPARKGLFEGTGRLFFEYYRVLNILKPKEGDPKPFFWLFENVNFMSHCDKTDICRFLECNPVLVDAVKVSPANRARCFWGNLPGMNRPITAAQNDKVTLQECLETGRIAKFTKVRTITTKSNSLKQGPKEHDYPVIMNGKDDSLWITELERIFGFPKHYTDVKNMGRQQRQRVLGKSWSVPVIRHLFAPLKDYFACYDMASYSGPTTATPMAATTNNVG